MTWPRSAPPRPRSIASLRTSSGSSPGASPRPPRSRRAEEDARRAELAERVEACTADIAVADATKEAILAGAALPVDGLGIDDGGVTFGGIALAQASGGQRLRVALALAAASAGALRDVWIRDGALLDDEALAAVEAWATGAGVRVWIERVGTGDDGAIVIRDGAVAS